MRQEAKDIQERINLGVWRIPELFELAHGINQRVEIRIKLGWTAAVTVGLQDRKPRENAVTKLTGRHTRQGAIT